MRDSWIEIVSSRLGPPLMTTSDEVRFNCWRDDCGSGPDTKYHVYVNPKKGKFFCQRCQRGGTLDFLARLLGIDAPEDSLMLWDQIMNDYLWGTETEDDSEDEYVPWPKDYSTMYPGMEAHRYLLSRGITQKRIDNYQLGFGVKGLKSRIIFPDINENDRLVYWVARKYGWLDGFSNAPKYKNADIPRKRQVYNLGRILKRGWDKRIVICEGPISCITAGLDAVATYGKYVTGDQLCRISSTGAKEYVIAFDGDAVLEGVSIAMRLFRRGLNVKFIKFKNDEDPNSVGSYRMRKLICSAPRWDRYSAMEVML